MYFDIDRNLPQNSKAILNSIHTSQTTKDSKTYKIRNTTNNIFNQFQQTNQDSRQLQIKNYNNRMAKVHTSQESSAASEIFGREFQVDDLSNVKTSFPPNYQFSNYALGGYEQCCISCGNCWICCCIGCNLATCCACLGCCCNFTYRLDTSKAGIVEQYGRYTRLLKPGFNFLNPCTQQVLTVDMRIKSHLLGRQIVITKDNIQLTVQAAVYYRPNNPIKVAYGMGLHNVEKGIKEAAFDVIRNAFGEHNLQGILRQRNMFTQLTKQALQKKMQHQGIHIENIFLTELILPPSIEADLNAAAKQKRLSEATIITSKAKVETASLMKESSQLLNSKAAMQIRYLQMLQQLGNSGKHITMMIPLGVNSIGKSSK